MLADVIKLVWDLEGARWLVTLYYRLAQGLSWRLCLPTPCLGHAEINFQAASRLFFCKGGCSWGWPKPEKWNPLGMDGHWRHNYLPFQVQGTDVFDLPSVSQKQAGCAAAPPWNTAGGKRNHFMVHSLLSPGKSQEEQWGVLFVKCLEDIVMENLGYYKSLQCFLST